MADYKAMYVHLFQETTKAINLLQEEQRRCEERYLESEETIQVLSATATQKPE